MSVSTIQVAINPSEALVREALERESFCHPQVKVAESLIVSGEQGLIAQSDIAAGTVIFSHSAPVSYLRTRTSIQIDHDAHIEADGFGVYTNHSCNPNAVIRSSRNGNIARTCLITIVPVFKNQEITFDYATTETQLTPELHNAPCLCRAANCRKRMMGNEFLYKAKGISQPITT